jgi:superfamily I DNA/RNA helicase
MTSDDMHASKGLGFPVVALPSVGHMPAKGEDEPEAARLFYAAATRATHRLVLGVVGDGGLGTQISGNESIQFTNLTGRKE